MIAADADPPARSKLSSREVWTIAFAFVVGPVALVVGVEFLAGETRWDDEVLFFLACGALLLLLTWRRPWWFWEHTKALWLRGLVGDRVTLALYTGVGLLCLAQGAGRAWLLTEARDRCAARFALATDSHTRVAINSWNPVGSIPHFVEGARRLTCGYFVERGAVKQ